MVSLPKWIGANSWNSILYSKGFWRCCITSELLVFRTSSIFRYSKNYKTQRFGNWVWVVCHDRRSVGQSVLVSSTHLGLTTRFLLVRQLRVCWCEALTLTRERICRLQLLLVLASAVNLGFGSRGTRDHILLSQIRDFSNLEGQVPVFISPQEQCGQSQSQSYVTTNGSVGQSLCLGIKHPSGAYDQIFITIRQLQACVSETISRVALYNLRTDPTENSLSVVEVRLPSDCIETVAARTWSLASLFIGELAVA
jgi:hypothetical protein